MWRYEKDSQKARDFRVEYKQQINGADYFCLLDSSAARRSEYVAEEIKLGLQQFAPSNKFVVCLVNGDAEWRMESKKHLGDTVIGRLNSINYILFAQNPVDGVFDPNDNYKHAISSLIKVMGKDYVAWADYPWLYDIQKEFFNTVRDLNITDAEVLIRDFENANHFWLKGNLQQAEQRFENLVTLCQNYPLVSPPILLGAVYFDQQEIEKAKDIYEKTAKNFPAEPRAQYGLGLSLFYLSDLPAAENAFSKTLEIIRSYPQNKNHVEARLRVVTSLLLVWLEMEEVSKIDEMLATLNADDQDSPEIRIIKIRLHLIKGNRSAALTLYETLEYLHIGFHNNQGYLNKILAHLNFILFMVQYEKYHYGNSRKYLERAFTLEPGNIRYIAELARLYRDNNQQVKKEEIIQKGLKLEQRSDEDRYFYGFMLYMDNQTIAAKEYYASCCHLGWSKYDEL